MYTINYFKDEIDRAYEILGRDRGELQNETDIEAWYADGLISISERDELRRYNKYFYLD